MKKPIFCFLVLVFPGMILLSCQSPEPSPTTTPSQKSTIVQFTPTTTFSPTPTAIYRFSTLPWPLTRPTEQQIKEVMECDFVTISALRYPTKTDLRDLLYSHPLETGCDWASLAYTYAKRHKVRVTYSWKDEVSLPDDELIAFQQMLIKNPAFALRNELLYFFFDTANYVEAPPFIDVPLTEVKIDYHWSGMGLEDYSIRLVLDQSTRVFRYNVKKLVYIENYIYYEEENNKPTPAPYYSSGEIDAELVQQLSLNLIDLFPIDAPLRLFSCEYYGPDWEVDLLYSDSREIKIKNYKSMITHSGAPWQITMDDEYYLQYSTAMYTAISEILNTLGLTEYEDDNSCCSICDFDSVFEEVFDKTIETVLPTPTNSPGVLKTIKVGSKPGKIIIDDSSLWVANSAEGELYYYEGNIMNINPLNGIVIRKIPMEWYLSDIIWDGEYIWAVRNWANIIQKINPEDGVVLQNIQFDDWISELIFDGTNIWVAASSKIIKINPVNGQITQYLSNEINTYHIIWDGISLWATDKSNNSLSIKQIDPSNGKVINTIFIENNQVYMPWHSDLLWDGEHLWFSNAGNNRLIKIDPTNGSEIQTFIIPPRSSDLAWDGTFIWVLLTEGENHGDPGIVIKMDSNTGEVLKTVTVGQGPKSLVWDGNTMWVANTGDNTIMQIAP